MKTNFILLILFLLLSCIPILGQSTFTSNMAISSEAGAISYYTEATVHGTTDTLITGSINLSLSPKGIFNIPIFARKLFNSVTSKPKIKIVRQEYLFGSWRDAKTLYTADSLETYQNFTADTLRAPLSRYLIIGVTGNPIDTSVKFYLRFLKLPN